MCTKQEKIIRVIKDDEVMEVLHADFATFKNEYLQSCKDKYGNFSIEICTTEIDEIVEYNKQKR